ncbi:MAG: hypothetical protein C5B54_05615 [Acidobacteria bacterium]|nr:MAG: hypothetical protein C5B54_05615 [Acidobacteriota bacterium]
MESLPMTPSLATFQPSDLPLNVEGRLRFLDGLRGIAAFYVMVGHARMFLWEGYREGYLYHPDLYNLPEKVLAYVLLIFSFQRQAVLFFFVLSGFLIHLRYARMLKADPETARFDWGKYVGRRMRRLYPPLIFALLLTFLLDRIGMGLGFPIYRGAAPHPLDTFIANTRFDITSLIGNLAFITPFYVPIWGSNIALWSLTYEWWFYMLYPALWWISKRSIAWATWLILAAFLISFLHFGRLFALPAAIFSLMPVWWFGALLADVYIERIHIKLWKIGLLSILMPILFPLAFPMAGHSSAFRILQDIGWAAGITGLLAAGFAWLNHGGSLRLIAALKPLGDMSYTLYVIHVPILVLLSGIALSQTPDHRLPQHVSWTILGILLSMLAAYAAHFLTEKHHWTF